MMESREQFEKDYLSVEFDKDPTFQHNTLFVGYCQVNDKSFLDNLNNKLITSLEFHGKFKNCKNGKSLDKYLDDKI